MVVIVIVVVFWVLVFISAASKSNGNSNTKTDGNSTRSNETRTIRCPNCGSPAEARGNEWECGWCGDCGKFR